MWQKGHKTIKGLGGIKYADDFVLVGESESDLKMNNECVNSMNRKSRLKVNKEKSKVIVFDEDRSVCNVAIWKASLEQVNMFKYLVIFVNKSGTNNADIKHKLCKVAASAIGVIIKTKDLCLECERLLHKSVLVLTLV